MAGHNIGENYVIDNGGMMNILQQGISRSVAEAKAKAAQRQADIDDLSKQINKLSPKGLASQDLPTFNKKLDELKDAYYAYRSTTNDADLREKKMEVDNKWRETFDYTENATGQRAKLVPIAAHYAAHPELYDDKALKDIAAEIAKPIEQVDYTKIDPLNRERKVDADKVNKSIYADIKGLLDGTAVDTKVVALPGQKGMKGRSAIQNVREADPTHVATVIQNHYRASDDFKKMLSDQYGKQTQDPIEQMAMYQKDLPKELYTKYDKPQVQTNQPIIVKTGGAGKGASATDQARLYTQDQVKSILGGDQAAIDRFVGTVHGLGKSSGVGKLSIKKHGDFITVQVPEFKGGNAVNSTPIPRQTKIIDVTTEKGVAEFGALYQRLTGEKVSPSVLNTVKGKKMVSDKAPAVDLKAKTTGGWPAGTKPAATSKKKKKAIPGF